MTNIYITWDGPFSLEDLKNKHEVLYNGNAAYGIYQVYGAHPVYGSNVLLYIGKADHQTFGQRISQEVWELNSDSKNIEIYIGKIFGKEQPGDDDWSKLIAHAEKLLIYTHLPAHNSSNIYSLSRDDETLDEIKDIRVVNYDNHRDMMSEVSGEIYIDALDWFDDTKVFQVNRYTS